MSVFIWEGETNEYEGHLVISDLICSRVVGALLALMINGKKGRHGIGEEVGLAHSPYETQI